MWNEREVGRRDRKTLRKGEEREGNYEAEKL